MALDPYILQNPVLLGGAVVVLHVAQVAITAPVVPVALQEVVLGQLEHEGKEHEQPAHDVVVYVPGEVLNLGPVGVDHARVRTLQLRDELWYVVDFCIVVHTGSYFLIESGFVQ